MLNAFQQFNLFFIFLANAIFNPAILAVFIVLALMFPISFNDFPFVYVPLVTILYGLYIYAKKLETKQPLSALIKLPFKSKIASLFFYSMAAFTLMLTTEDISNGDGLGIMLYFIMGITALFSCFLLSVALNFLFSFVFSLFSQKKPH